MPSEDYHGRQEELTFEFQMNIQNSNEEPFSHPYKIYKKGPLGPYGLSIQEVLYLIVFLTSLDPRFS